MEILLILQPFAEAIACILFFCLIPLTIGFGYLFYQKTTCYEDFRLSKHDKIFKIIKRLYVITLLVFIPACFVSTSDKAFKNQIVYKIVTADKTEKIIDNINLLIEKLHNTTD